MARLTGAKVVSYGGLSVPVQADILHLDKVNLIPSFFVQFLHYAIRTRISKAVAWTPGQGHNFDSERVSLGKEMYQQWIVRS